MRFLHLTYSFVCYAGFEKFKYVLNLKNFWYSAHYFWLSFSYQEDFRSKRNIERETSTIWIKRTNQPNKQKWKKELSNHLSEISCIWDLLYFHIITFSWKNICERVPFYKICRHTACNCLLNNENDRTLG